MDFKRIGRIFIIAFGLLNLYLINSIVERQDIQNISNVPSDSSPIASMESSNITLPNDLSETDSGLEEIFAIQINTDDIFEEAIENSSIHTGTLNSDNAYYTSFPSNPIELAGNPIDGFEAEDFDMVQNFIQSNDVLFGNDYTYHRFDQEGNRFVFYQGIDGIPITDGTSEISLFVNTDGDIISYQQTYAGQPTRQGDPLLLISGTRAVEILFLNNEIRQESTVLKPMLSYRRALHLEDLSMYSPIWLIVVEHASERNTFRVDAVNGTIIRQTSPSTSDSEEVSNHETDETEDEEEAET